MKISREWCIKMAELEDDKHKEKVMNNVKKLAEAINGREYREETTPEDRAFAKENNLIIIFGGSDDLCYFEGAYSDEASAYEGDKFYWLADLKKFISEGELDETADCPRCGAAPEPEFYIEQTFSPEGKHMTWGFETNFPIYEKFLIHEEGEIYGEGLVIQL